MNKTIHIIIPIYISDQLHLEFTEKTLASIHTSHSYQTFLIDNYHQPQFTSKLTQLEDHPHLTILQNPKGNSLSAAWNLGIKTGLSVDSEPPSHQPADYILILNNDIILHPECIDHLVKLAQSSEYILWSASEWSNLRTLESAKLTPNHAPHPHFSCFMINQKTIDTVGTFDENLSPAYFEDNDYHTRILLAGKSAGATDFAKFYHFTSRTTSVDDSLAGMTKRSYEKNREYMKQKWGIDFHAQGFSPPEKVLKEIYSHPFNNPSKDLKDW